MIRTKTSLFLSGLLCAALPALAVDYSAWTGHQTISLNTTATGANVAGTVTNFPVLIRLGANESAILSGANNGNSIRFSKADNATALPFQIESWSSTSAVIWVKVDTVKGNATTAIRLHYGNSSAASESNGATTFDTANGFRGVWHLNDSAGRKSVDATVLNTNAQWYNSPVLTEGLIGKALNLNQPEGVTVATANHLRAEYNTTNNNFKATSANGITLSVWIKHNPSSGGSEQGILGRYNWGVNARQAILALNSSYQIRLFRSLNGASGNTKEANFGTITATDNEWFHVVGTVKNGSQILYVNGVLNVKQDSASMPSLDSVWANSALAFGHMAPDHAGNTVNQAFNGFIDEARFAVTTRDSNWVKLEYQSQKTKNSLSDIGQPTVPGAPTNVTGVVGNASVTVTWVAPASNGGSSITGYKAMVVGTDSTSKTCSTTGALSCVVGSLTNGTAYTFVVRAVNEIGSSVLSTASAAYTPAAQVPGAPTAVTATPGAPGSGTVTVGWVAPFSNGGSAITGYKAMTTPDTAKFCNWTTGTLSCAITGLTNGTAYTFVVKASNAVGSSVASASASTTVPVSIAPGSLRFAVGRFARSYTFRLPENLVATDKLSLSILDASGRAVWERTVTSSEVLNREISWNGKTANGTAASAGMYIARVMVTTASGSQEIVGKGVTLQPGK